MNDLQILSIQQLLELEGLRYLQVPKAEWRWNWKMRPFVCLDTEPWPGYTETKIRYVCIPALFTDALLQAGWQRQELECYWRFIPPETNNG